MFLGGYNGRKDGIVISISEKEKKKHDKETDCPEHAFR